MNIRLLLSLLVLGSVSCRSALPLSPSAAPPQAKLLCASGQSNMNGLLPALKTLGPAQGFSEGSQPIKFWDAGQRGWTSTEPFLVPACGAFIWAQGETDNLGGISPDLGQFGPTPPTVYQGEEQALFARVRELTTPVLPMYVIQLAPQFTSIRAAQAAACEADAHCTYVTTDDLTFPDGTHLDAAGYAVLAQRLTDLSR